jgi:SagB-type dehydrogenase family enzyme
MLPSDDDSGLALLFHLNSEPRLARGAVELPRPVPRSALRGIALLAPEGPPSILAPLLASRRSCRAFEPEPLALSVLSSLLRGACGVQGITLDGAGLSIATRSAPSAGACYPIEALVLANRVEGLPPGVHHYEALHQRLEPCKGSSALIDGLLGQEFVRDAAALVVLYAEFARTLERYGPRGYRFILMEAGHLAQTLCLLAAEHGLGSICVGGFEDHVVNAELGFDPRRQGALYLVAVGRAKGQ